LRYRGTETNVIQAFTIGSDPRVIFIYTLLYETETKVIFGFFYQDGTDSSLSSLQGNSLTLSGEWQVMTSAMNTGDPYWVE
jgi:hypothetical protein